MKRYFFKKNETEIARLKMDLFYYAKTMGYDYICDENDAIWACEIRKNKDSYRGVAFVIRNVLHESITIEMGIINWISKEKLVTSFYPELLSEVKETSVSPLSASTEKEIRHDMKVLAKVRLGSYFDSRKDI